MELKRNSYLGRLVATSLLVVAAAHGEEGNHWLNFTPNDNNPAPVNRFRLSYRPGFNINAKFKTLTGLNQANDPGAATRPVNHNYDDGYNRVDSANNDHGGTLGTWNWGYEDPGQVSGTTAIFMHSVSAASESVSERNADAALGLELGYSRQLGRIGRFFWGVEGAFNYTDLSIKQNALVGNATLITDQYDLAGLTAPQPPFHGSFEGPGPIIGDDPTRTQTPASVSGMRQLNASLYGLRLGPYVETAISKRLSVAFSGGLALAGVQSDFRFDEIVAPTSGASVPLRGKVSKDEILPGVYAGATLSYTINEGWSAFAGAQYQYLGNFRQTISDREVTVDLGKSVFITVGIGSSF
jgi:hypothetical protein